MLKKFYYELHTKVYLLKDISYYYANEFISNLVNYSLLSHDYTKEIHLAIGFKNYSFSSFYPVEKDFIYKANNVYSFMFRTYDEKLAKLLKENLNKQKNEYVVVLTTEIKIWEHKLISELQTYTPAVAKLKDIERKEDRDLYWTKKYDVKLLIDRIQSNLQKKHKVLFNKDLTNVDMVNYIEITNKKPCVLYYKKIKILGNKLKLAINTDEISQQLANTAIVTGILEKNSSLGCGFCKGVYIE